MKKKDTGILLLVTGCIMLVTGIATAFFTESGIYPALIIISVILNTIGIDLLRGSRKRNK